MTRGQVRDPNGLAGNPQATEATTLREDDAAALLDFGPGKRLGTVVLVSDTDENAVRLPIAVVSGTRPGPTAWINGSLHGDEYLGPASIAALLHRLNPGTLRGRVILTPSMNLGAVRAMQREDPERMADWNRIWSAPPSKAAVPAAIAWAKAELLERADLVIDLHSGGNHFIQAPFAVYPRIGGAVDRHSSTLAKACGLPWIWAHQGGMLEGALITAAARRGKRAVLLEIAGEGKAEPIWVRRMVTAVHGALAHAGVIRGRPRFRASYRLFTGFTILRNRREGRWSRLVAPEAQVRRDQPIGRVVDFLDREVETVRAPRDSAVMGICTYGFVARDDYVAELAHRIRVETSPA